VQEDWLWRWGRAAATWSDAPQMARLSP